MVKLSGASFHDESSITIGLGVRECNSALNSALDLTGGGQDPFLESLIMHSCSK